MGLSAFITVVKDKIKNIKKNNVIEASFLKSCSKVEVKTFCNICIFF